MSIAVETCKGLICGGTGQTKNDAYELEGSDGEEEGKNQTAGEGCHGIVIGANGLHGFLSGLLAFVSQLYYWLVTQVSSNACLLFV